MNVGILFDRVAVRGIGSQGIIINPRDRKGVDKLPGAKPSYVFPIRMGPLGNLTLRLACRELPLLMMGRDLKARYTNSMLNQSQGGNYIFRRWQRYCRCKHQCIGSSL